MENKRSIGVTAFGIIFIIQSASVLIKDCIKFNASDWMVYYGFISSVILLILAINILQLKEWSRKGIIYFQIFVTAISVLLFMLYASKLYVPNMIVRGKNIPLEGKTLWIFGGINMIFVAIATFVVIYFFTRPKVKEQFS